MIPLNSINKKKWFRNLAVFTIPIWTIYLGSLTVLFGQEGHIVAAKDFIPNALTLGGILYYIQSSLIDFRKKYQTSTE